MDNTCIIYSFSGTGNSHILSEQVKKHLSDLSVKTTIYKIIYPINFNLVPNPNDFDYIGFSYPIHGLNAPKPFIDFVKKIPFSLVKEKAYFVLKNSGEPFAVNNGSSATLNKIMSKKGYKITLEHHYLMPYNIMFEYKKGLIKQMYLYCEALTKVMAIDIVNKKVDKIHTPLWNKALSALLKVEWIAGPVNHSLIHVDEKKCIHCNKCISQCSSNALYFDKEGKIKANSKCCICMACSFNCPVDALKMGILNPWRVNFGGFKYESLLKDENVNPSFVNANTKGYFKYFRKYYKKQDELLTKYNIPIPVKYN